VKGGQAQIESMKGRPQGGRLDCESFGTQHLDTFNGCWYATRGQKGKRARMGEKGIEDRDDE
jgi:hypothetical protein